MKQALETVGRPKRIKTSPQMPLQDLLPRLRIISNKLRSKRLRILIQDIDSGMNLRGSIMNGLMATFRDTRSIAVYTLLYELNFKLFLSHVIHRLKRYGFLGDPEDIVQEVFISIYRYARRFREENQNSFRNWSLSIIQNAIFKEMRRKQRYQVAQDVDQEFGDPRDIPSPLENMVARERFQECARLYCVSLCLYLHLYNTRLTTREKIALHLVEVENLTYKAAAASMKVKLENFKMIVCRARKKIFQCAGPEVVLRKAQ